MATRDTQLRDVLGGKSSKAVEKTLGLSTVGQLLRHYPRRFNERGELTDLSKLVEGDEVTVLAEVESTSTRRIPGRKLNILEVSIRSGRHRATLSFFNQPWRERELRAGRHGMFAGKVTRFRDKLQLNSPDYILLGEAGDPAGLGDPDDPDNTGPRVEDFAGALLPVYPAAAGLPSWTIARCVRLVLDQLDPVPDPLTTQVRSRAEVMELDAALRQIHRPNTMAEYRQARRRLAFDEALGVQLVLAQRRHASAANPALARPRVAGGLVDAFDQRLPFEFTGEQREIAATLEGELAAAHPMHRLLQGEVGSGKTVLALRAAGVGHGDNVTTTQPAAGHHQDPIPRQQRRGHAVAVHDHPSAPPPDARQCGQRGSHADHDRKAWAKQGSNVTDDPFFEEGAWHAHCLSRPVGARSPLGTHRRRGAL